jgi:hypothetical protein
LQNDSDAISPNPSLLAPYSRVGSKNRNFTAVTIAKAFEDFYSGGLASAIGAEKGEYLTWLDR